MSFCRLKSLAIAFSLVSLVCLISCGHGGGLKVESGGDFKLGKTDTATVEVVSTAENAKKYVSELKEHIADVLIKEETFKQVHTDGRKPAASDLRIHVTISELKEGAQFLGMQGDGWEIKTSVRLVSPDGKVATLQVDGDNTRKKKVFGFATASPRTRAYQGVSYNMIEFLNTHR